LKKRGALLAEAYELYVFDLDRTLVETESDYIVACLTATIETLGGIVPQIDLIHSFWVKPNRDHFIRRSFGLDPDKFWPLFNQIDSPSGRVARTRPIAGASAVLRQLKQEKGKKLAVITGAMPEVAAAELALLDVELDGFFALGDNGAAGIPSKPHPKSIFLLQQELGISGEKMLFTGDSFEDNVFCRNGNLDFVHYQHDGECRLVHTPVAVFANWNHFMHLRL